MNPPHGPLATQRAPQLRRKDGHILSVAFRGHVQERATWWGNVKPGLPVAIPEPTALGYTSPSRFSQAIREGTKAHAPASHPDCLTGAPTLSLDQPAKSSLPFRAAQRGLHASLTYQASSGSTPSVCGFELAEDSRHWAKDDHNNSQHVLSVTMC